MNRFAMFALVALASTPCPSLAQFGGGFGGGGRFGGRVVQVSMFTVTTVGQNKVTGSLDGAALTMESEELGTLRVPIGSIRAVEFGEEGAEDVLTTWQNSVVRGRLRVESVQVQSEFGPLTLPRSRLRSIEVAQGVPFGGFSQVLTPAESPAPAEE